MPALIRNSLVVAQIVLWLGVVAVSAQESGLQKESQPSQAAEDAGVPSYSLELRELAKLRDDGIITNEDYDRKKAQILGLEPCECEVKADDVATTEPSPAVEKAEPLIVRHCKEMMLQSAKSPSSVKFVKVSEHPSVKIDSTKKARRQFEKYVPDGHDLDEAGTTVTLEYDAANSYGAMLRGEIWCDYIPSQVSPKTFQITPRLVSINGEFLRDFDIVIRSLDASLAMADFIKSQSDEATGENGSP